MEATFALMIFAAMVVGGALGALIGILWSRGRAQATVLDLTRRASVLETQLQAEIQTQQAAQAQQERLRVEFENLAQKILDQSSKKITEQHGQSLGTMLGPLREKLEKFEKKVEDSYNTEAKERFALKTEVQRLMELNQKITQEAQHLTQALKGDSKVQGDWGEVILERILEQSGLREGEEYVLQTEFQAEDGARRRPDAIINLPDGKHIIVDSKVSLKAYESYSRATDDDDRVRQVKLHLASLEQHVSDLSDKHYPKLKGIESPDFVFLFMPIEAAYLLAMQSDPDLGTRAWSKGVAIVTSTTLFTSLKTVASLWKFEHQQKNAVEIAAEAGRMYDKFVGFLDDMESIGKQLDRGREVYGEAMVKLKSGTGNLIRRMEKLREMGATPTKKIRKDLLELSE